MAEITKVNPSLASLLIDSSQKISGLVAGEDLGYMDACYIKASDGKVWKSTGAAANAAAKIDGYNLVPASAGQPCTLGHDFNAQYGSALTPGTRYFLSDTVPGGLATVATTGGTASVAFAVDTKRVHLMLSRY